MKEPKKRFLSLIVSFALTLGVLDSARPLSAYCVQPHQLRFPQSSGFLYADVFHVAPVTCEVIASPGRRTAACTAYLRPCLAVRRYQYIETRRSQSDFMTRMLISSQSGITASSSIAIPAFLDMSAPFPSGSPNALHASHTFFLASTAAAPSAKPRPSSADAPPKPPSSHRMILYNLSHSVKEILLFRMYSISLMSILS